MKGIPFTQVDKERLDVLAGTRGDRRNHAVRMRAIGEAIADLGAAARGLAEARDRLESARGDLTAVEEQINTPETGIEARLTAAEASLSSALGQLDTIEADLNTATTGLKDRMTAAESTITAHGSTLDNHESRIAALETHHP